MSHHQGRGDRSEPQLKKAGRAGGGPGHSRAGGGQSISLKGGGPGPFNSAPAGAGPPQPSPSVASAARPTAVAASTNRGGKRANGPSVSGRGAGPPEQGANNRVQQLGSPVPINPQQQVVRQGVGPADTNQQPQIGGPQQNSDLKGTMPGRTSGNAGVGAPGVAKQPPTSKPPAPPASMAAGPEASTPSAAASPASQASQNSFQFQFGDFAPMGGVSTSGKPSAPSYPLRTNSAPPSLDEQMKTRSGEQARYEPRPSLRTAASGSGQQQNAQIGVRNVGGASEQQPAAGTVQHMQAGLGSQGLVPVAPTAQAPPPQQLGQTPGYPQHPHLTGQQMMQFAQMHQQQQQHQHQQQQHHHHQQQQQQAMPQQQGMVQERLNQGMKYPPPGPMMPAAHHNPQLLGTTMGSQLPNALSAQTMGQMAHQLGPNMGGPIPAGISYGPPPASQFIPQKPQSRAIKIVDPKTHEELKLDSVKKESPEMVAPSGLASGGRNSSNGLSSQQRAPPVTYNHMAAFYQPYSPAVFSPGLGLPGKASGFSGAQLAGSPPLRNYYNPGPPQGMPFGHPGGSPVPPGSKVGPQLVAVASLGSASAGPVSSELLSTSPVAPLMMGGPVQGIPAQPVIGNLRANAPPLGMNSPIMSNGRPPSLSVPPVSPPAPLTPSSVLPSPTSSVAFKFGDVEASASGSAPVAGSDASSEGSVNGANGHASTGADSTSASVGPSYVGVVGSGVGSGGASAPVMGRPSVTVVPPKPVTGPSNASGVSPRMMTSPGTGGAGTFGEKVKADAAKTTGNPNVRKNNKKRQQQQQQHQQASSQGPESEKTAEQGGQNSTEKSHSAGSGVPGSHRAGGLQRTQSGAHGSTAVYAPVKNVGGKAEESKAGNGKGGGKTSHPDTSPENEAVGEVAAASSNSGSGAAQNVGAQGKVGTSAESESTPKTDTSEGSSGSAGLSSLLAKDEPTGPVAEKVSAVEDRVREDAKVSGNSTSGSASLGEEAVRHVGEGVEVELGTFPSSPKTPKTSGAGPVEDGNATREAESSAAGVDEKGAEVVEQVGFEQSEAGDGAGGRSAEYLASPVAGLVKRAPTVDECPAVAEAQEPSTPAWEGHIGDGGMEDAAGSEVAGVEESGVLAAGAEAVEKTDVVEEQVARSDDMAGAVGGSAAQPVADTSASEERATVPSSSGEEAPKAVAENGPQSNSSRVGPSGQEAEIVDVSDTVESRGGLAEKEEVSTRRLEHAESTASNSYKSEANAPSGASESESDLEIPSLVSSTSGISVTEASEVVQTVESETDTVEARIVGNPSSGQEGVKAGSKKKKKKEFLARADAAGNTADLYNAYKVPEEKKSVEVKRTEVSGANSSGSDAKESVATQDKSVPKEVDDWEDAAELPTPSMSVAHPVDTGDRKYTRDFLITFREQNRELPANFEIRHDIAELLLLDSRAEGLTSPARNLDRQSSGGGQRGDRRGGAVQQGADEDRWTRQPGLVPSPGRNQPGDARMDMSMQGGFRPGQGLQPGLITQVPQHYPGMAGQAGFSGLIQRGPGNVPLPHFMTPGPPVRSPNGVDGDRWLRQPMAGGKGPGLIPSPRTPLPAIHKAENRYEVGKVSDEEQAKQRLIKGILNKLTPQNFDKLFVQVQEANIDSATTLTGVISQIFDKALMEPTFCEMYATFCVKLAVDLPEFTENEEKFTFKRVLLNKCQEEFERGEREQEEAEKDEEEHVEVKMTAEEREEKRLKARRRMLGNIRFIGELYKKSMLTERIMHECIKKLLGEYQNPDEEDVEALCKLMSTIGRIIDHQKAKEHIDAYFRRMESLSNNQKLSSRLRFMLKDCIELRRNDWQERRKVDGPKKIDEVHRDAVQERQQAARGDRLGRGPSMGGGSARGRMGSGAEFGMRGPPSPMYSPGPMGAGAAMNSMRRAPSPQGGMRGGGGFVQDVRMEDRSLLMEARPVPMPLSQRGGDEGNITLGPQGGLGRVGVRQQALSGGRSGVSEAAAMMSGAEMRRLSSGPVLGYGQDRAHFGSREELPMRPSSAERPRSAERPILDRPMGVDRVSPGQRELRSTPEHQRVGERSSAAPSSFQAQRNESAAASVSPRPSTAPAELSEEELRKKWDSTIKEYYSVGYLEEAAFCVEELRAPHQHAEMVFTWVSESLEKKDRERDLLVNLLLRLHGTDPPLLTHDQLAKGVERVLSRFVDTVVDVPKAPEFLGAVLGRLVSGGVFTLLEVGRSLETAGEVLGEVREEGHALTILGAVLDTYRKEKGEEQVVEAYKSSGLDLEEFVKPSEKSRSAKSLEAYLKRTNLLMLHPMLPVETHVRDSLDRKEPILDLVKWIEKNVPSFSPDPKFLRKIMTEVLRHAVKDPVSTDFTAHGVKVDTETYAPLLKKCGSGKGRAGLGNQLQYINAIQLFANEYGHPKGLMSTLFGNFYHEEVISEDAYINWKDDIEDPTPGRDEAFKEVAKWLSELESELATAE